MLGAVPFADPWRFQPNVEVYVLVLFLVAAYVYVVREIGPKAVPEGEAVITRRNLWCFVAAMVVLFVASTWPIHQIGEDYLYFVHMLQHMMLSYFLPPLVLLATPEWLMRVLIGNGRTYKVVAFLTRPVVAAVLFNGVIMVLHIPGVVNTATVNGPLHYLLHLVLVLTALLMWAPVVGPFTELQMKPMGKMIYLFLQGVVPTVPSMWLSMADSPVYHHYGRQAVRVWGINAMDDQQIAGVIMKVGGSTFMWIIMGYIYFARFGKEADDSTSYRRNDPPLTFDEVTAVFD
ncbi:MAG: cytochrome c oxidase assembly protein, partial [Actinomycetota bacterium]